MNVCIQTKLSGHLVSQAKDLVDEGWAGNLEEVLADALRRYLESHSAALSESFIREDVEWGLHGET